MAGKNLFQKTVLGVIVAVLLVGVVRVGSRQSVMQPPTQAVSAQALSCLHPANAAEQNRCTELEQSLLDASVVIELQVQTYFQGYRNLKPSHSHATIMAGRYLVTHNHFKFSLTETAGEGRDGYLAISLRRSNGELILDSAPLSVFNIAHADPQTLVLEFPNTQGVGLFDSLRLPSADFVPWNEIRLEIGDEVAQIDWNGATTHVVWTQVSDLQQTTDVPQFQVDHFARIGCSGGGVFWQGQHIGNNWARNIEQDASTSELSRRYSIIALNSTDIEQMDWK